MRYVLKDCGKHYGKQAGECSKCEYNAKLMSDPVYRSGTQGNGTPWIAVLGPPLAKPHWWDSHYKGDTNGPSK
jgi:hypothetical protein